MQSRITVLSHTYIGHIYAVYLPSSAAASPSAAAEKPRANDTNLPSYLTCSSSSCTSRGFSVTSTKRITLLTRVFSMPDKEWYSTSESYSASPYQSWNRAESWPHQLAMQHLQQKLITLCCTMLYMFRMAPCQMLWLKINQTEKQIKNLDWTMLHNPSKPP